MTRSRGRPIRPMPVHPERVISRAVKAGLSATIRLQRAICNRTTRKYYERSSKRWSIRKKVYKITKERGNPDFSYISKAEAHTRDDIRLMFYEEATKYGFTEVSRQKNADDTVDSLNQRFNVCGSVIRENSEIMFPLPDPVDFGTYTRRDGKGRKKFKRAGYEVSSFGPKVILAHPNLPALDFGDAVRSHNEYLATFCAIHDVSVRETTKYSQLFYLLTRPYLEYLYSEFTCGKANFQKGVNWALRQVKELILAAGYRPTIYEKRTVTKKLGFYHQGSKNENKMFFKKHEREARELYGDHPVVAELSRLIGKLGDADIIDERYASVFTLRDVDYIRNEVAKKARIAGSIMHRRISDIFPCPWHLNDVILSGDRYSHPSDYLIIAEVPIQTAHGAGKVDIILCERTISEDGKRIFWKPVFILEIKTRLGQSWNVDANYKESEVRPDGSSFQRVVASFPLRSHPLSDALWNDIVKSTPTPIVQEQLNIYCQALGETYKDATQEELGHILRGVVVIESSSDIIEIRKVLEQLIVHGYQSIRNGARILKRTIFTPPASDKRRIALVIDKQPNQNRQDEQEIATPWTSTYTPFKTETQNKRKFMLYLAGHSPTSAGQSAAWNARYYHGLQFLYDINKTHNNTEFIWLDLASQFNEPRLAEARLRLKPRSYSEEDVAKVQPDYIREFFEDIEVHGYLDDVMEFLYNDGNVPSFDLVTGKTKKRVIVVTGVETLRDATPTSHRDRFSEFVDHLLSSFPDDERTTVVWFDSPVPSVEKSTPYSTRALIPYYDTSALGQVVTEIIWNLPVAPKGAVQPEKWGLPVIGNAPMHDDIRVIIRHSSNTFQMELVHVPFLRGWSKRFRNKGTGLVTREREIDDMVPEKRVRNRMKLLSLTMVPWLMKLWSHECLDTESIETLEEMATQLEQEFTGENKPLTFTKTVLTEKPTKSPRLLDLVKFRLSETMDALSYQKMTAGKINSQRLYRSPRKLQNKPLQYIPITQPVEDISSIEEETKQEWMYGVKFESKFEHLPWWMIIQDPIRPSRILVGCFTQKPPDKEGFLWAESKQELQTQSSLDEILGFQQTILIGRKNNDGLELWSSVEGEAAVFMGILHIKSHGRSTTGSLRAMRQTVAEEPRNSPSFNTQPSESFYRRMVDSLRRQLEAVSSPTPVKIHLEMVDNACRVSFENDEGERLQDITIEYTADLISRLRWPTVKGGPMFTDKGEFVIWSIFDDINYGELDFMSSYVTYAAARKTPAELPKRVSQFFDEGEVLTISISHDTTICPIAQGEGVNHGACWRIELPSDCSSHVKKQLGRSLTGEEVNGLLAPKKFYADKLYTFEFACPTVSEMNESIVFHEERYIRMFLRSRGLPLKRLTPGTFLGVTNQLWVLSTELDDRYFKWKAQSTISTLFYEGREHYIELVSGHGAQEECERLLTIITSKIPAAHIFEYANLKEQVLSNLKERGYSMSSPLCELRFIEQTESIYTYGIFLSDDSRSEPVVTSTIDATETKGPDAVIDGIARGFVSDALSGYNIKNVENFLKQISNWVYKYIPEVEEFSEGQTSWTVTLSVDVETGVIDWVAKQDGGGDRLIGEIVTDPNELQTLGQEAACEDIQLIFTLEVVPQLKEIDNLENVLDKQIPDMVRSIRYRKQ